MGCPPLLLTMVKEKRNGIIKGRACADGRKKQQRYITKEEAMSPTVQLESLMMSLIIDAKEERDVATADVVGAYLLADLNDHVIIKFTGESVKVMCKANASYKNM